jgi:hypothetical protein
MRYAILLVPLLVLLAACDGGAEETQPTTTPSPAAARPSPTLEPTPSPGRIAYRDGEGAIWLVDADGKNLRRIGDRLYEGDIGLERDAQGLTRIGEQLYLLLRPVWWSPDGTKVAVSTCPPEPGAGFSELLIINSDGTGLTRASGVPGPKCWSDAPFGGWSWAPDASKLVSDGLYIIDADGGGVRLLTNGAFPHWSPTGDSIAFVKQVYVEEGSSWEVPIYAISPDGSNERVLARVPRDCSGGAALGCVSPRPEWSPDGARLGFTAVAQEPDFSRLEGAPNNEVFVINADGTGLTNVSSRPGEDYFVTWVNCQTPLPTAGCQVHVTVVGSQKLNVRQEAGTHQEVLTQLIEGDIVCMLGSPGLADGVQWWPVRSADGIEGWAARSDPNEPERPWLTPTGHLCQ